MEEKIKNLFAKKRLFVRIHTLNNDLIIWNDKNIFIKFKKNEIDSIEKNIDLIIDTFQQKIEKKYLKIKERKVSVIIPNFNNEKFIKKTIESILNNTYKNIEIILVDDCSTDNTVQIVKDNFGDKVKIYKNDENKGAYYCRNKGIYYSTGYYVTIVDGDDYIEAEKIEYEVNKLENQNKYWGIGTHFQRLYIKDDIEKVHNIKRSNSYVFLFKRKLFNYLGFFQNNRFGADSEFIKRASIFKFPLLLDNNKIFYNAYTLSGKNLTHIHRSEERRNYMEKCKKNLKNKNYIEMAFLDSNEFAKLII